jgi:hypothetical protein
MHEFRRKFLKGKYIPFETFSKIYYKEQEKKFVIKVEEVKEKFLSLGNFLKNKSV